MTLLNDRGDGNRRLLIVMVAICMAATSLFAVLGRYDDGAEGASVGTIKVTGGASKSYTGVSYTLDGDIEVSGTNSRLFFTNSTITFSQDVGADGVLGGGDDHIYHVLVENGGSLYLTNTKLTTLTGQLHPYFALDITIDGSGSRLVLDGSVIEGPGSMAVTNQATIFMNRSSFVQLAKQDKLGYDIDGDGSVEDDMDFNDDGIELTISGGAKATVYDSQIRDTRSFTVSSRDGFLASNITLDGSGTNLTAVNTFLDVDLESNKSTGSHNTLKVQNGAVAHLVGVTINTTATTSHPAIMIMDSTSKAVYYRWIGSRAFDGVGIGLSGEDLSVYRIDGSQSVLLSSNYLTSGILGYMGRSSSTWARTDRDGWSIVPVITDVFTFGSMPNSEVYPDFKVSLTMGSQTLSDEAGFQCYPYLAGQGSESHIFDRFYAGEDVSPLLLATTEGTFEFMDSVASPSTSPAFSALGVDMSVSGQKFLKGTTSIVDGVSIPSYYSFDGHLTVNSGGTLTINDTCVAFLTDDGPAYILVQNGGTLALNNVTLKASGAHDLYVYVMGTSTPSFKMTSGTLGAKVLVARNAGSIDVRTTTFTGIINSVGSGTSVTVMSEYIGLDYVYARNGALKLGGGSLTLGSADLKGVSLTLEDARVTETLDLDKDSLMLNTTFNGTLPEGRTYWVKALGNAVVQVSYKVRARVIDSVSNPIPGSTLRAYRVTSAGNTLVSTVDTDEKAEATLVLVQDEIRSTGRSFLGNYLINATYSGYSSTPYSANMKGTDIDLEVTISGGPDITVRYLTVVGALIASNQVTIRATVVNDGEFASGPFKVSMTIDGTPSVDVSMPPLGPGALSDALFNWTAEAGESNFIVRVDVEDTVRETDEKDNVWSETDVIGYGPDYAISLEVGSTTFVFAEERTITVRVRNVGEPDPEQNPVTVIVEWRKDASYGQIGTNITLPYISPGREETRTVTWAPSVSGQVMLSGQVFARFDRAPMDSYFIQPVQVKTLPDLRVREGSFILDRPLPVTINTNVGVSVEVENSGELPSGQFMVGIYDGSISPANLISSPVVIENVDPGTASIVSMIWRPAAPASVHDLIVVIDTTGQVKEQDEGNNNMTFQVATDTEPDLFFYTPIGFSEAAPTDGTNITLWAQVGNKGRTMAQQAEVRFTLDGPETLIDRRIVDLVQDQVVNVTINWEANAPGQHTVYVVLDYPNMISEASESNNLASKVIMVKTKPDIAMGVDDLVVDPLPPLPLNEVTYLNATVWNYGETDANNVIVTFYDGDPSKGGRIISWMDTQPSVNMDKIGAQKWKKASVTWTPAVGGMHTIYVVMDPLELIPESDESNNVMTWDVYVKTLPDLTFAGIVIYQGGFQIDSSGVGKNVVINITMLNAGDMPAGEFAISVHNGNPLYETVTYNISSEIMFPSNRLKGNSVLYIEIPWTVEYPKGVRNIYVEAWMLDGMEQDLGNNFITTVFEVYDLEDVPEVVPLNESLRLTSKYEGLDPLNTRIGYVGLNLSVRLNVTNLGGKAASNLTVQFISENVTRSVLEREVTLVLIDNGDNVTVNGWWKLASVGWNTLRVVVDPLNKVREFDEGNNLLVLDMLVLEAPDLSVKVVQTSDAYDPSTGQFKIRKGEVTPISFEVINEGNYTYNGLDVRFTGDATNSRQTISVNPNSSVIVTFMVDPENTFDNVRWKCVVNTGGKLYESDMTNNDDSADFQITEVKEKEFPWLLAVLIVVVIALSIFGLIYLLVLRAQKGQMAKCSNCGGLVEVDAPVCKHCGIEFSEEIECECGTLIPAGAKECPSCHKPVLSMQPSEEEGTLSDAQKKPEIKEEEVEPEEIEEAEAEEEAEEAGAPEGKEAGSDKEEGDSEMAECFECGAVIPISAPICPHCGAVFE